MQDLFGRAPMRAYGPDPVCARARFAGAAATSLTLLEALGIKSVTQSSTTSGLFTVTLADKMPDFTPRVLPIAAHADMHDCPVFAVDFTAGTFQFAHYIQASRTGAHALSNGLSPLVTFNIVVYGRTSL